MRVSLGKGIPWLKALGDIIHALPPEDREAPGHELGKGRGGPRTLSPTGGGPA